MPDLLDTALDLASQRYAVFPLDPDSKTPSVPWRDVSTDDAGLIEAHWPVDANIGIDCGKSGVVVVDIDVKHGPGLREWNLLCRHYGDGDWPVTWTVETTSGGLHFYFEAGGHGLRNSQGLLSPNIDTRGDGGFVVGWKSEVDGRPYTVLHDDEVAELPAWLVELEAKLRTKKETLSAVKSAKTGWSLKLASEVEIQAKVDGISKYLAQTSAPGRNNTLHWAACRYKEIIDAGRLDMDAAVEILKAACELNGLAADDGDCAVLQTVRSAFRSVK